MAIDLSPERVLASLERTLTELQQQPIDLLNIGDGAGEVAYLANARPSYRRTLLDVAGAYAGANGSDRPPRILEIGSYLGVVSLSLARLGMEVTALDIPEFVANRRLRERYGQAGVEVAAVNLRDYALPFADGQFDMVVMCETLEHLNFNPLPVMAEINRVLADRGRLYLSLPNLASLPQRFNLLCGRSIHNPIADFVSQLSNNANMIVGLHWREYTRNELLEMLVKTGFRCVRHTYDMPARASLPAALLYLLFPALRPGQRLMACKTGEQKMTFHYTSASRA